MRRLTLGIVLSVVLFGCGEKEPPAAKGKAEKQIAADVDGALLDLASAQAQLVISAEG